MYHRSEVVLPGHCCHRCTTGLKLCYPVIAVTDVPLAWSSTTQSLLSQIYRQPEAVLPGRSCHRCTTGLKLCYPVVAVTDVPPGLKLCYRVVAVTDVQPAWSRATRSLLSQTNHRSDAVLPGRSCHRCTTGLKLCYPVVAVTDVPPAWSCATRS